MCFFALLSYLQSLGPQRRIEGHVCLPRVIGEDQPSPGIARRVQIQVVVVDWLEDL
jgi:hypothetical protein